jgi:(4-O-methyl)-D-glucuronate---lignin esterase
MQSAGLLLKSALSILIPSVLVSCATNPGTRFPDAAALPSQPKLPNALVMLDGRRVTTREQWERERRPELKALFQHYMYGDIPKAVRMESRTLAVHRDFLDGKATLKLITLDARQGGPVIDLILVVPNNRPGPAPVFLAMNFCGNHALTLDPRVPLTRGWLYPSCKGCTNNLATEAARGGQAQDWPLARLVERGYALASFCTTDIDSDRKEVSDGIYAWLAGGDPERNNPTNRGSIAAWAWGFHRCVDYLVSDRDLDPKRIAAVGHSRNGKTALLAAAFDERIAISIPHQAGCGGTSPNRVAPALAAPQANGRPIAETTAVINKSFPHWFNGEFKKFDAAPDRLPFDQNALVALCAPRPVLFSNAQEDQWANPTGQFEVLQAADPVYRFLGVEGLSAKTMPSQRKLVDSRLGYYIREGKHSMTADDWEVFMNFAERHFGSRR